MNVVIQIGLIKHGRCALRVTTLGVTEADLGGGTWFGGFTVYQNLIILIC